MALCTHAKVSCAEFLHSKASLVEEYNGVSYIVFDQSSVAIGYPITSTVIMGFLEYEATSICYYTICAQLPVYSTIALQARLLAITLYTSNHRCIL